MSIISQILSLPVVSNTLDGITTENQDAKPASQSLSLRANLLTLAAVVAPSAASSLGVDVTTAEQGIAALIGVGFFLLSLVATWRRKGIKAPEVVVKIAESLK